MDKIIEQLGLIGILPVVTIDRAEDAEPLARALAGGGLPCIEVTYRTDAAEASIRAIAKSGLGILLGAGTVQSVDQVKQATDAGARFMVCPGLNRAVVEYCLKQKITVIPGVATPTDIELAREYELSVLKFFPAEANGGVSYLQAIGAPYGKTRFIPTGGIDESNLLSYLKLPNVLACGGSWMVRKELIDNKRFQDVQMLASSGMKTMLGLKLQHVGIHEHDDQSAEKTAAFLAKVLQFDERNTPGSVFVGSQFEILKSKGLGEHGHIAIGTHFIDRAVEYFARLGIRTKPETRSERNGQLATVYLDLDIAGFAVHLVQL